MTLQPFHIAFPVHDLGAARSFYCGILGCTEGRSTAHWVDFNFYGHQIVAHLLPDLAARNSEVNPVDSVYVPIPHFGIVLEMDDWRALAERLKAAGMSFVVEPYIRFKGQPGEQATMAFRDPSGNAIEMKAFERPEQLFAK